jgi:hypothetical protein
MRKDAILSPKRFIVRPATADDIDAMSAVAASSGLSSVRPEVLEFYLASPGSHLFAGCRDDRVIGVARILPRLWDSVWPSACAGCGSDRLSASGRR